MPPLPPSTLSDQSLAYDGAAIVYRSRIAPWLRVLMLIFVLPLPVCLPIYFTNLLRADWAAVTLPDLAAVTVFLVLLPLLFAAGALIYALRVPQERLRLDPDRGEALLHRKTPLGQRQWSYPLLAVLIDQIEFEGEHPSHQTSRFRLRMPDGRGVWVAGAFREQEARNWLRAIRRLLSGEARGPT